MNNAKKIAGLAALGLIVAQATKTTRSANVSTSIPNVEPSTVLPALEPNAVANIIKSNAEIQALLKGPKGDTGATGQTGPSGTHGAAGDSYQNYGGSLIKNGALEHGSLDGWTGTDLAIAADPFEGMPVIQSSTATNSSFAFLRTDKLYKVEYFVKGTGNHSLFGSLYNRAGGVTTKTNANGGVYFKFSSAMTSTFTKQVGYIGGVGIGNSNMSENTVKIKLSFLGHGSVLVSIAKLVVAEVGLGEPVPYNLPFLPVNQMVYDPTTSEVGIYNGTTVVWFAS